MTSADIKKFRALLTALAEQKSKTISDAQFALWWDSVSDMDIRDFEAAIRIEFRVGGPFMPSPGQLRERVQGTEVEQATLAWVRVRDAIGFAGTYASVRFDDPAIHGAIDGLGGWIQLCQRPESDLEFTRREFEKHYKAVARALMMGTASVLTLLIGLAEAQNRNAGRQHRDSVVYIGNREKADAWIALQENRIQGARLLEERAGLDRKVEK